MNSIRVMELGACLANFGVRGWFGFIFWSWCLVGWFLVVLFKPCLLGVLPVHLAFRELVSRLLEKQAAGAHKFSCELLQPHENQFHWSACSPYRHGLGSLCYRAVK